MSRDAFVVVRPLGRIEIPRAALAALVTQAATAVPGVQLRRPRRRLEIVLDGVSARVELAVTGPLDGVLPDVGRAVQTAVAEAVRGSTGLPTSVDVAFGDLA